MGRLIVKTNPRPQRLSSAETSAPIGIGAWRTCQGTPRPMPTFRRASASLDRPRLRGDLLRAAHQEERRGVFGNIGNNHQPAQGKNFGWIGVQRRGRPARRRLPPRHAAQGVIGDTIQPVNIDGGVASTSGVVVRRDEASGAVKRAIPNVVIGGAKAAGEVGLGLGYGVMPKRTP